MTRFIALGLALLLAVTLDMAQTTAAIDTSGFALKLEYDTSRMTISSSRVTNWKFQNTDDQSAVSYGGASNSIAPLDTGAAVSFLKVGTTPGYWARMSIASTAVFGLNYNTGFHLHAKVTFDVTKIPKDSASMATIIGRSFFSTATGNSNQLQSNFLFGLQAKSDQTAFRVCIHFGTSTIASTSATPFYCSAYYSATSSSTTPVAVSARASVNGGIQFYVNGQSSTGTAPASGTFAPVTNSNILVLMGMVNAGSFAPSSTVCQANSSPAGPGCAVASSDATFPTTFSSVGAYQLYTLYGNSGDVSASDFYDTHCLLGLCASPPASVVASRSIASSASVASASSASSASASIASRASASSGSVASVASASTASVAAASTASAAFASTASRASVSSASVASAAFATTASVASAAFATTASVRSASSASAASAAFAASESYRATSVPSAVVGTGSVSDDGSSAAFSSTQLPTGTTSAPSSSDDAAASSSAAAVASSSSAVVASSATVASASSASALVASASSATAKVASASSASAIVASVSSASAKAASASSASDAAASTTKFAESSSATPRALTTAPSVAPSATPASASASTSGSGSQPTTNAASSSFPIGAVIGPLFAVLAIVIILVLVKYVQLSVLV
ncbi:hypothetical protein, variant [Capsaspora owczarzaki ATCC 30864]|uniref:Uncharacterized protein n=1 Tax=Capsaspora owczarzaki (strain ATCC 30864) TaxID=595528 RepID=A0A0D2WWP9_CAPO3|nr:hypothetical protein, variant [Capsaspora owczarzaki ATCC 30864]